jgi:D-alanine--poly(phosphoribitol) ligase subunit 2
MRDKLREVVLTTLQEIHERSNRTQTLTANEETVLFGIGGILDSLGLVNLIVGIEQRLEDELGVTLILADERAMAQKNSPFRTVGSLLDYIARLIEENGNG